MDGIDDEINIRNPDKIRLVFVQSRSITLWFKADDPLRETKQVLYQEGDSEKGLNIYLEVGRLYIGGWLSGDNDRRETFLSTELVDTNWHHVALICYAQRGRISFAPKAFYGYLDGLEFGRGDGETLYKKSLSHLDGTMTLGANGGETRYHDGTAMGSGDHFAGIVDEFHLWNKRLRTGEVIQLVGQHIGNARSPGPEVALSSVDHSTGSLVIPPGMGIVLDGSATGNSSLETRWETVITPEGGQANFENPMLPSTVATFSTPGYYKLRFSADDGVQMNAIDVDVHAGLDAGFNFQSPQEVVYLSMDEGSGQIAGNSADESYPGTLSNPQGWTPEGGGISGYSPSIFY